MSLSRREKIVLGEIVRYFIISAIPVSSTLIAKKSNVGMSPATIRNIMAELEHKGYIYQPHTSAGRVPKTLGYRAYVDSLMKKSRLTVDERSKIHESIQQSASEFDDVLHEITGILAQLSHQLGIIISPRLEQAVFQRMELINLSSDRILVIITVESGFIKTITLEVDSIISGNKLHLIGQILNERLQGMKISEIRKKFSEIVKDLRTEDSGLVKIIARRADRMFDFGENMQLYFMGTHHIVQQPDFSDVATVSSVVELLENREFIVHFLDEKTETEPITIKIGEELKERRMQECSIITARYNVGSIKGILGIIGPKRMNYSKLSSLVDFTARSITEIHGKN